MDKLTGKIALVTGASKGIGAGIAKALGEAGASVIVNYSSSKEGADRVVTHITKHGGKAIPLKVDMSKVSDVEALFAAVKAEYGRLDILVNNAGVFHFEPLTDVKEAEFHREFNINVLGPLLAIQQAVKLMDGEGSIINITLGSGNHRREASGHTE